LEFLGGEAEIAPKPVGDPVTLDDDVGKVMNHSIRVIFKGKIYFTIIT
jgi:hypothetical protein